MSESWTTVLRPKNKWYDINLKELWAYKDLVVLFVKRNYVTRYKQTVLGPLWLLITPIVTTIMYALVFGEIAGISTDGAPQLAFYLSGNVVWTFFAMCLNNTSRTFIDNAAVFGKVYFPRLVTPIATVITGMLDFLIQLVLLIIILVGYSVSGVTINWNWWILATPLLMLQIAVLGLGFGIIVSSLTTKYRDLSILVTFGVQLWMYASPVVYPLSQIPERFQSVYMLNPVAPIITIFRYAFLGVGEVPLASWGISWIVTIAIFVVGALMFNRIEKTFMDTV